VNNRRIGRRTDFVKWIIWVPWVSLIVMAAVRAGGYRILDLLYGTVNGISVAGSADRPIIAAYVVYFAVVALFFGLPLAFGRRASCHAVCWMAPFMITGRALRNTIAWPSLRLQADTAACIKCGHCAAECPMSLDVDAMVGTGHMEHAECILCGKCVDGCPKKAIRYTFSAGK